MAEQTLTAQLTRQRKIIHIDMDCFYAAVEMRDNPQYRDIPLAIGGKSEHRAVLSTCNYLARKFGVRSAMPSFKAKQLCPDLLIVPGRMSVYVAVSQKIKEIFYRYTDLVEPLSLDEAFLDVSDCTLFNGSATYIAEDIRRAIFEELNLTASAGIAPCKFLAKIASDENKPNGQCVITPAQVCIFIKTLALKKIPGVGKVAQQKLALKGLFTCLDVQQYPAQKLLSEFGKLGAALINFSQGIDERTVKANIQRKSLAVEQTFALDLISEEQCLEKMRLVYSELERRLQKVLKDKVINKVGVKIKFNDFSIKSSERQSSELSFTMLKILLHYLLDKNPHKPIRLLGISVGIEERRADSGNALQLSFIDNGFS
ncbi:DNA polymerase IV [Psychromonas antarctica]|uniref:DNA polymerase IV n=1 Tax=Psychromonas antarctica TaxID=67573 RepID=UPI0023B126F5|nr:DNA polymerase IV [Psychromonas antarctica]